MRCSGLLAQAFRPEEGGRNPRYGGFSPWGNSEGLKPPSKWSACFPRPAGLG
jgi:hypothetical protein